MGIVNKYRIKDGITIEDILKEIKEKNLPLTEGGSWVHEDAKWLTWFGLDKEITANIVFPEDLSVWDSYDHITVMDEAFGQPYYPFYYADEDETKRFPTALSCIGMYNKRMNEFNFLEKIK